MLCSRGQIKEFASSAMWKDINAELEIWLGQIHEQLENHGMDCDHRKLDRLGGAAEAVRNFGDILTVLDGILEAENEDGDHEYDRKPTLNNLTKGR